MENILCSNCHRPQQLVESDPARNHWFGQVCPKCKVVFCPDCLSLGGFVRCPNCRTITLLANRSALEQVGFLTN